MYSYIGYCCRLPLFEMWVQYLQCVAYCFATWYDRHTWGPGLVSNLGNNLWNFVYFMNILSEYLSSKNIHPSPWTEIQLKVCFTCSSWCILELPASFTWKAALGGGGTWIHNTRILDIQTCQLHHTAITSGDSSQLSVVTKGFYTTILTIKRRVELGWVLCYIIIHIIMTNNQGLD